MGEWERIGDLCVRVGQMTREQVEHAATHAQATRQRIGAALIELGYASSDDVARILSKQAKIPPVKEAHYASIDASILALVPAREARRLCALPLWSLDDKTLTVAMRDPRDLAAIDALSFATGKQITPGIASERRLRQALDHYYPIEQAPSVSAIGDKSMAAASTAGSQAVGLYTSPHNASSSSVPSSPVVAGQPSSLVADAPRSRWHVGRVPFHAPTLASIVAGLVVSGLVSKWTSNQLAGCNTQQVPRGYQPVAWTKLSLEFTDGWRQVTNQNTEESNPGWTIRSSAFFKGGTSERPHLGLLLGRMTPMGFYPDEITEEEFTNVMRGIERGAAANTSAIGTIDSLTCALGDVREDVYVADCEGSASYEGAPYDVRMFFWIANAHVAVMSAFISAQGHSPDAEIAVMVPSIEPSE